LNVAQAVFDAIVTGNVTAWNYWELVGNDPAFELEDNEALIGHKADGPGNPTLTKRLFTLGNFSKFVRPGHIKVATSGGVPSGLSIVSFVNPNDDMPVVVAINATGSSTSLGISLQGSSPSIVIPWVTSTWQNLEPQGQVQVLDGGFTATLPAQSVTTFVGQH
jgi:glucuronoarabinoxylan endo-1,4-beta-xylanase